MNMSPSNCMEDLDRDDIERMRVRTCELEKKLVLYDAVVAEKDELREQLNDIGKWVEQVMCKQKEMFDSLSSNYDSLWAKYKETKTLEAKLKGENDKLKDDNDRISEQLRCLKRKEQQLLTEIEKLEKDKNCAKVKLCDAKEEVNELNNEITKLQCNLSSKEESLCSLRKQLDDSRREQERLRDNVRRLESDTKHTHTELTNIKSSAARTEQKLILERDTLSNELETKRRKLCELQTTLDEQKCILRDQKTNICKLESMIVEMKVASERDRRDSINRIRKLSEDNCSIQEEVSRKNKQIDDLRQKIDSQTCELSNQRKQVKSLNCAVDEMRSAVEKIKMNMCNKSRRMENSKQELECKMKSKNTKIADLDRETSNLRKKIQEQTSSICCLQKLVPEDSSGCLPEPCDDVNALIEKYSSNMKTNCDEGCNSNDKQKIACEIKGLSEQLSALKNAILCNATSSKC